MRRAIAAYNLAERHGYVPNQCRAGRWMCWMLLGRFELAWRESNLIAASGEPIKDSLWDGKPLTGRIMIRCLHGYGDTVQFIRYMPMVRRIAERVIVQAHPEVLSLLRGVSGIDNLITWAETEIEPRWDRQIEVMELPRAFATTLETIPRRVPYISISQDLVEESRRRIGSPLKPAIGIVWRASDYNPERSIACPLLLSAFQSGAFALYSLQHGIGRADCANFSYSLQVRDLAAGSPEIVNTAADILSLDLIITVDTLVAHLAGALAKPVWLLLPYAADWRWMVERRDSPWYPTMHIFRQPTAGAWDPVIRELRAALDSWHGF